MTETKKQTAQVLEEINKIEKKEGTEIQEINVGEVQISKNELLIKEHNLKGNEFYYKKEYEKSIEYYDKALEIDPYYTDAWNNKGLALNNLGKYNEAIEYYDKALEIGPNYALARNNKDDALRKLVEYKAQSMSGKKSWKTWFKKDKGVGMFGSSNDTLSGKTSAGACLPLRI